ncbi:hypothetical protein C8J57DRAFT_1251802 [Mycena rebaudengoi]|nr:hypothetical protein C8J57DRAFT_1251802 [Mycena rebaudengoi]
MRHSDGPIASGASGLHGRSGAEAEMWREYEENGADFSAGDDAGDDGVRQQQLHTEAESFGLLDPEAAARKLGFGGVDLGAKILAEDEDFLSEIMRNTAETPSALVVGGSVKAQNPCNGTLRLSGRGQCCLEDPEPENIQDA